MAIRYIISLIIFLSRGLICTGGYDIELRCPEVFKDQEIYDITCLVNITTFSGYDEVDFYIHHGPNQNDVNLLCTVKILPAPQNCGPVTSGCGCLESSNREPHVFVYKYKANKALDQNGELYCTVAGVLKSYTVKTTESCKQLDFAGPKSTSVPKGTSGCDIELLCPEVFKDQEIYDLTCLVNMTTFLSYDKLDFYVNYGPSQKFVKLLCTVKIPPAPQNCGPVTSGCGCLESFNLEPHIFVYKYKANKALHQNGKFYCKVAGVLKSYTIKTTESCKQLDFGGPSSSSFAKGTSGYDIELLCPEVFKDQEIYDLTCLVNMTTFLSYDKLDFYVNYGPSQKFVKLLCTVKIPPAPQNCGPVTSGCGCLESFNLEPHIFVYKYKANKALHQNGKFYCKVAGVLKSYTIKTTESCKQLDFGGPKSSSFAKGTRGYDIELHCPEVFKDQEIYDLTCLVNMTTFLSYDNLDFYVNYGPSQKFVKRLCTVKIPPAPQNCGPVTSGCGCLESFNLEPHVFVYKYKANKALHQNGKFYCKVAGVLKSYTITTTESCKQLDFDFLRGSHGKKWNLAALLFFIQLI